VTIEATTYVYQTSLLEFKTMISKGTTFKHKCGEYSAGNLSGTKLFFPA
jgi:hypothetical protein